MPAFSPDVLRALTVIAAKRVVTRRAQQSKLIAAAAEEERALTARLQAEGVKRYIPHTPWPKQSRFLRLTTLEALYGGAAGPGKSDALLMAALEYVDVPGYAAILFRRTFVDAENPDALIPRSKEWLANTDAHYDEDLHRWTFPSGASLSFGSLPNENAKYNYQGAAYQFIGFDELTQFTQSLYSYMQSRCRRPRPLCKICTQPAESHVGADHTFDERYNPLTRVPLRIRAATNPGGRGGDWVKEWFDIRESGDPAEPWQGFNSLRPFVPARLEDNPALDVEEYLKALSNLDPVTREQLRNGDWGVRGQGGFFRRENFQFVDEAPAGLFWIRFWDFAATDQSEGNDPDWTAGVKLAQDEAGNVYVGDITRRRGSPGTIERLLQSTAELDGKDCEVYLEQEPGASGKAYVDHIRRRVLNGFSVHILNASSRGSKITLAGPFASQVEAKNVFLVRGPWNRDFIEECEPFPSPDIHDDQVDAASSAYFVITGSAWQTKAAKRRTSAGVNEWMRQKTPPCIHCGKPVYFMGDTQKTRCPHCGKETTRGVESVG